MNLPRSALAIAACVVSLSGCDAGFCSRIQVDYLSTTVTSDLPAMEAELIAAMRAYARSNGLQCDAGTALPMRCEGLPVHVVAFRTDKGAMVCYSALGIPLEGGKFQRRINELERSLNEQTGITASAGQMTAVMPPQCSQGWAQAFSARH